MKLDCYVNFTTNHPIMEDIKLKKLASQKDPYKAIEFRGLDENSVRYESHLSHFQETTY